VIKLATKKCSNQEKFVNEINPDNSVVFCKITGNICRYDDELAFGSCPKEAKK